MCEKYDKLSCGTNMIAIVDYEMGNLHSVQKAFEKVGAKATVTSRPEEVSRADKVVLPGVGAFRDAIGHLRERDLVEPIREVIKSGRPFLGICLGLQLLFERSFEDGEHDGLGIFPGTVVRFDLASEYKVPHMGWNELNIVKRSTMLTDVSDGAQVYFVHSYYAAPADRTLVAANTNYGTTFASIIERDNVFATQFHPEKSQFYGLAMLRNFANAA